MNGDGTDVCRLHVGGEEDAIVKIVDAGADALVERGPGYFVPGLSVERMERY